MKQGSTQTIHLSLGLTQPEHSLVHSPWASIHHCISSCSEAGSVCALEAKAEAVPIKRVQSLLQPMYLQFRKHQKLTGFFFTWKLLLSWACPVTGDCLLQGCVHKTLEAFLHTATSQHPLKSHGFPQHCLRQRRKGQTLPCNINAIFQQKSYLCCAAREIDRNYLLNLSNFPIISCCKETSWIAQ